MALSSFKIIYIFPKKRLKENSRFFIPILFSENEKWTKKMSKIKKGNVLREKT